MDIELKQLVSSADQRALFSPKAETTRLLQLAVTSQQHLYQRGLCPPCFEGMAYVDPAGYFEMIADPDIQVISQETYLSGIRAIAITLQVAPEIAVPAFLSLSDHFRESDAIMVGAEWYIDGLIRQGKVSETVAYVERTNPWSSMGRVIDTVARQGTEQDKKKLTEIFDQAVLKRMPEDRAHVYGLADRFAQINPSRALAWIQRAFAEAGSTVPFDPNLSIAAVSTTVASMLEDVLFDNIDHPARLEAAKALAEGRLLEQFSSVTDLLLAGLRVGRDDGESNGEVLEAKALALALVPGTDYAAADLSNRHICTGLLKSIPLLAQRAPVDMSKIKNILFIAQQKGLDGVLISKMLAQSLPILTAEAQHWFEIYNYDFEQALVLAPALLNQTEGLSAGEKSQIGEYFYARLRSVINSASAGVALKEIARYFPHMFETDYRVAMSYGKDNHRVNAALGVFADKNPMVARIQIEQALADKDPYVQSGAMEALASYYPHDPDWTLSVIETTLAERNHIFVKQVARQTLDRMVHGLVSQLLTDVK